MKRIAICILALFVLSETTTTTTTASLETFKHPGILHTKADLDRMKQMVSKGVEPWKSGFEKLKTHPQSSSDWKLRGPFEVVSRAPGKSLHKAEAEQDANAAYQNALMWYITDEDAHAKTSIEIFNAWSYTLKEIPGKDRELAASLDGFKFVNAAEIIRHTYKGWQPKDAAQFTKLMEEVFYPVIKNFATFANGNWDTGCIKTMMAIGVFCDDRSVFDRAVDYYYNGSGNGRLTHYIINDTGQCQESGRDQQHVQLGIGHLAEACEIGWNQGLDMYGAADNRLLKGFEYTATYNLDEDVPFTPHTDKTGEYIHNAISPQGRGRLRPIWEMVLNHYQNRKNLATPYTKLAAEKIRPEGAAVYADHPGFGTLLFTRPISTASGSERSLDKQLTAGAALAIARGTDSKQIKSPDGKVVVEFILQPGGIPAYKIEYLGKPIALESRLGFEPDFTAGFQVVKTSARTQKRQWSPVYGERRTIPDNYGELDVDLKHASGRRLRLTFRDYNEGAAFRYSFPLATARGTDPAQDGKGFTFTAERTEFRFPENTYGYESHGTEGPYRRVKTSEIEPWCERPLTLEYSHGLLASLTDAGAEAYPRTLLSPAPEIPGALITALGGPPVGHPDGRVTGPMVDGSVKVTPPFSSTWRLIIVGEKPGDLLERNYLVLNLSPPLALKETSWIKPGKAMREVTLSTPGAKAVIDFAAKYNLQYVGFDAGWYGAEDFNTGDATKANVDPQRVRSIPNHPGLDLQEVIRYGREKNVGVVLYVDRRQIKKQRDILFPLYEKWGVKGVKIGFIEVGPQAETAWMLETVKKAAEHHLVLDIHDQLRVTGYPRAYPNLLTVEGIRGNEQMPTPEHNATLPFTRYIAGPGDYTVCYYTNRKKTTFAHQLAMAVVSYSPMQWVFWYDKPTDSRNEPELEFFARAPTVWDDTRVLHGKIGEYAAIARRSGDEWFMGAINNGQARRLLLPLGFLDAGKKYVAHIYSDDPSVETRTRVKIERFTVERGMVLNIDMTAAGGQAVRIVPAKATDNYPKYRIAKSSSPP